MLRVGSPLVLSLVGAAVPCVIAAAPVAATQTPEFQPRRLSAFELAKAERLLREKLPCLGCHTLDGDGGRIGPGLSGLKGTRPPDYVFRMITDPQGTVPGTVMPRVPMSRARAERIASYLVQREPASDPEPLARAVTGGAGDAGSAEGTYARLCAACHGATGDGDGPNAQYLPVRPTAHSDSAYMSQRPDDALFDAIYAGGYVMGRSPRMPPYGATLTRERIWGLVRHLRTLCSCQGPEWSRDNR